jgi:hypothetical protein
MSGKKESVGDLGSEPEDELLRIALESGIPLEKLRRGLKECAESPEKAERLRRVFFEVFEFLDESPESDSSTDSDEDPEPPLPPLFTRSN